MQVSFFAVLVVGSCVFAQTTTTSNEPSLLSILQAASSKATDSTVNAVCGVSAVLSNMNGGSPTTSPIAGTASNNATTCIQSTCSHGDLQTWDAFQQANALNVAMGCAAAAMKAFLGSGPTGKDAVILALETLNKAPKCVPNCLFHKQTTVVEADLIPVCQPMISGTNAPQSSSSGAQPTGGSSSSNNELTTCIMTTCVGPDLTNAMGLMSGNFSSAFVQACLYFASAQSGTGKATGTGGAAASSTGASGSKTTSAGVSIGISLFVGTLSLVFFTI
ncbi:UNVERIFIED_CONTAM: hypothetical protein HDU68_011655 [Siphonaria sp. JEL0065]|nr:hypothetical protein HDU68_011655 [Siphonaria sp. JEL0065]